MKTLLLLLLSIAAPALAGVGFQTFNPTTAAVKQTRRPWFTGPVKQGNLPVARTEISGLARSGLVANNAYLWCIEDGALSRIAAVTKATGAESGAWTCSGITTSDVEDCDSAVVGGIAYLYIFDTGDNANARSTFKVLRCKEPVVDGSNHNFPGADVEEIIRQFPGANIPSHKDMEGIFVENGTGDMYFITKRITPILCYKLAHQASYSGTQTLSYLGAISGDTALNTIGNTPTGNNGYVTGACISPNGTEILLITYDKAMRFSRNVSTQTIYQALSGTPTYIPHCAGQNGGGNMSIQTNGSPQVEAITFDAPGLNYYFCSELVTTHGGSSTNYPLFKCSRLGTSTTTYSFQEGVSSYTGTRDTYIDSTTGASTSFATTASLVSDFDYSAYPTVSRERAGLLLFDTSTIPTSSTVVQAYLELYINTEGLGLALFKILTSWTESSTWNSLSAGLARDNADAASAADVLWGPTAVGQGMDNYTGFVHINLPVATVQGWVSTPASNYGYEITGPDESTGDGLQWDSREGATTSRRPKLVIVTTP